MRWARLPVYTSRPPTCAKPPENRTRPRATSRGHVHHLLHSSPPVAPPASTLGCTARNRGIHCICHALRWSSRNIANPARRWQLAPAHLGARCIPVRVRAFSTVDFFFHSRSIGHRHPLFCNLQAEEFQQPAARSLAAIHFCNFSLKHLPTLQLHCHARRCSLARPRAG